jgi:hypothetical protein
VRLTPRQGIAYPVGVQQHVRELVKQREDPPTREVAAVEHNDRQAIGRDRESPHLLNRDRLCLQNENIEPGNRVEPCVEGPPWVAPGCLLSESHTKQSARSGAKPLGITGSPIEFGCGSHQLIGELAQLKGGFADRVGTANDGQQLRR